MRSGCHDVSTLLGLLEAIAFIVRLGATNPAPLGAQDILLSAFKALDPEGRGWIDAERMKELLCGIGSPGFKDKEFEAFAKVAADRADPSKIYYEDYCALMSR